MLSSPLLIGLSIVILGLVILIGILIWQAMVRPYTYEDLFILPEEGKLQMSSREGKQRIVPLEGTTNFRDIGGYQTTDGQRVKWGKIYRSARLLQLTPTDLEHLSDLGIETVVDFRQTKDIEDYPDRLSDEVRYVHMPIFEDSPISLMTIAFNRHRLLDVFADFYANHIVERGAEIFGRLMAMAADEEHLPLVFHCTAGKDRTGVAAVLILTALGVPRETAVNDYLLTNRSAQTFIDEVNTQLGARNVRGVAVEQLYPLLAASPRLINAALDHIDRKYGGVVPYLQQRANVDDELLKQLRQTLLEDGR